MDTDNLLIKDVINLNKRSTLGKPLRTEPTVRVSEFNLVKSGTRKEVVLTELTDTLKKRVKHAPTREKVQNLKKKYKVLPKPLEKPKSDRIRRSVAFDKVKEQLDRYNAVLEQLEPKSKVKIYDLEKKSPHSLTMQEMLAQRKEMAKMKVMESFKAAKARHQNKIKSKKYHRIQRREKVKDQIKNFEQLRNTDQEGALKKLDELERVRAEERASLRHRNTGKWARSKQVKAKYDKMNRQELAQQLSLSHELTQKTKVNDESESENEAVEVDVHKDDAANNLWVNRIETTDEVDSFVRSYRKFWEKKNSTDAKEVIKKPTTKSGKKNLVRCVATSSWDVSVLSDTDEDDNTSSNPQFKPVEVKSKVTKLEQLKRPIKQLERCSNKSKKKKVTDFEKLSFKKNKSRPEIDEPLVETSMVTDNEKNLSTILNVFDSAPTKKNDSSVKNIDPNNVIRTKAVRLQSELPDLMVEDEEERDGMDVIAEAFEDDDIVEDFQKEKASEIEKSKPEDINLFLPGWGSWGGPGIKSAPKKRTNKRFIIKFPEISKRKDENKGNLVINENSDANIKSHLVSEVPFPFKTVKDFEESIRAPIGNTFIPETAYKKMIRPSVKTKMGKVIEPMSEDILLKIKS
ncbi:hypothetical protein FQR65_LT01750 [Abscondita terminalis]|nr:hypothetical protein FQR65_LT01750 [Abscondita terminalis]